MKTALTFLALLSLSLTAHADKADELYKQGMAAAKAGDAAQARIYFNEALKLRPDHAYARFQLGQLKGADGALAAQKRKRDLAAVTVSVNFQAVELSDALMALGQMVEKTSAEKNGKDKAFTPNFMVQDPSGKLGTSEVTLKLKGVPANKVMDFMLQQTGGQVRYDEHAIIIRPNAPTTTKTQ